MQDRNDRIITDLMEQLIASGPDGMASAFTTLLNLAMRLEREQHLGAQAYERTPERGGYANGYKPKRLDTAAGTLTVQVPKSRGGDEAFYPQSLERGRRSTRAVMLAVAQMYIQGVSTRDVEKVMAEFGLESLSSTQVSRAAAQLDEDRGAQRSKHGARCTVQPVRWVRSATCFLTPATRRCGSAGSSAMPRSSRPLASMGKGSAAF